MNLIADWHTLRASPHEFFPEDANPMYPIEELITFNPKDKIDRKVGLSAKEGSAFGGICEYGAGTLIKCIGGELGVDEYISPMQAVLYCKHCKHCVADRHKARYYDPWKLGQSIFSGWAVLDYLSDIYDPDDPHSYVYFISDGEYIKIGKADNPVARLSELQVGNPRELKILYLVPAHTQRDATKIEGKLHLTYRDYRIGGEWFDINGKLLHEEFEECFSPDDYVDPEFNKRGKRGIKKSKEASAS